MRIWLAAVTVVGVLSAPAAPAAQSAAEIRVTPVVADGAVLASFSAASALGADTRAVVQSGLLVTLTFAVALKRPATGWWDRVIHGETVSSSIKLDTLSGTYQVSRMQQGHVTWSDRTKDFAEARDWATTFERIPVAQNGALDVNAEYYLEVRMTSSPNRTFSLWPFGGDQRTGRADFTFIQ
jgi:hypothetical protein